MDNPKASKRDTPIPGRAVDDPTEGAFPHEAFPLKKKEKGKKSKVAPLPAKQKGKSVQKKLPIDPKTLGSMRASLKD